MSRAKGLSVDLASKKEKFGFVLFFKCKNNVMYLGNYLVGLDDMENSFWKNSQITSKMNTE